MAGKRKARPNSLRCQSIQRLNTTVINQVRKVTFRAASYLSKRLKPSSDSFSQTNRKQSFFRSCWYSNWLAVFMIMDACRFRISVHAIQASGVFNWRRRDKSDFSDRRFPERRSDMLHTKNNGCNRQGNGKCVLAYSNYRGSSPSNYNRTIEEEFLWVEYKENNSPFP